MKEQKNSSFDYKNFEQQVLQSLYEGKPIEQALAPLLKRLVEASLQGEMRAHSTDESLNLRWRIYFPTRHENEL
jgi:hypothetical protein